MNMQNTSETDPPIGTNLIKAKVKTLPNGPGVYRMLGSNDDVLYVGKAKNLKNRVSSYTRISGHSNRIANMIRTIWNLSAPKQKPMLYFSKPILSRNLSPDLMS